MRSFGAAALFTLAVVTECLAAHSDRSRQRSSPIRSVPVAANVKRDVDFDCPEEFGYYPHPTDCTLYYVCVFGGALQESCTGGLMYSHELQTCDWPRNVGCDGTSAIGGEELERISEREPPPPPPPRRKPPPPPRAQPNPVVTSRGQPKYIRDEYEKQQQLYAEVDDLPPVEEIESDRQQRVNRGQPPTIGQVQKDRDGYGTQVVSSGRNFNSNIIPASIPQNSGKLGSFSFGSQADDRRTATVTQAPRTYSLEPTERIPASYSASPRPKMLYNGSQSYIPDQYDPYYAVYDEDGELYKDADYVQQYNTASLRPAVQQTYRGTPPPPRRPVETYSPRPVSPDDYDDALIQGQISNQNQYQSPIRHSTRGEGNELGYDHNPSSVRTTVYEATTISTTPSTTTSTSTTTTQRPTTAPFTEAMTPSRYTPRLSSDESPSPKSESPSIPSEGSLPAAPSTRSSIVNFSSLAKPFERTDNTHRLRETLPTTEKLPTPRRSSSVTNNNKLSVKVERPVSNTSDKKKVVSLTTGFSIRRNSSNTNNPYTLTVLTRPLDEYNQYRKSNIPNHNYNRKSELNRYKYDSSSNSDEKSVEVNSEAKSSSSNNEESSESSIRRKDSVLDVSDNDDIPVFVRPTRLRISKPQARIQSTSPPTTTKFYLKTVIKRPSSFSNSDEASEDSTENTINTEALIETALHNAQNNKLSNSENNNPYRDDSPIYESYENSGDNWNNPAVSPYRTLDNLRGSYKNNDFVQDRSTSTTYTTRFTTTTPKEIISRNLKRDKISRPKPSYYSYRLEDDIVPDQTTEVFSGKVTNVIKTFLNKFVSTSAPYSEQEFLNTPPPILPTTTSTTTSTTSTTTTTTTTTTTPIPPKIEDKIVNIGYQKKIFKYVDEKPLRNNVKRLQIITEPSIRRYIPSVGTISHSESTELDKDFSSTNPSLTTLKSVTYKHKSPETTPMMVESSTNEYRQVYTKDTYQSKFNAFMTSKPIIENTNKIHNIVNEDRSTENSNRENNLDNVTKRTNTTEASKTLIDTEPHTTSKVVSDIASTTSTTKSTMTLKIEPTTSTTKSISFPTRASRVNPAIKLAATNPGSGRRSYQSSSKCSSDNSLQANPKCNEIKYQRPTNTRGRGSAHYSTGSDAPPPAPNRGTPPTRSRPTLKPSTAIVTKTVETADIYTHPPGRPAPVYPQPTPDKTAAKCRKDVCLLPDCYCGGKDIPGELPVETVPQIVLLTFDDSVNDLNKGLYADLFEKGRVNPNGCPISATFYVSHEWTDYSQVQNLYSAGHEMASHTVSHSFGEQFSQKKWNREVGGQREILAAYGGVKLEDVRGMRAPFLSVGGNKMFKMLYDSNFTYDSSLPVYENRPPSWPYTLDYKLFHDCMIPPCPTKSYPGVWEVPMVMWQDLNGGRCSMGDACANPSEPEGVYKMILKNFDRHYTTNRAPFGLFYHAAWFTQPHHKEGFIMFLDFINKMQDVWIVTNWQALQWVRDPTPISRMNNFQPFQCNYQDRPKKCNNPKVCNLWHKSGVRYMRTCQPCPEIYPWTGKTGIRSSRIDNDISE